MEDVKKKEETEYQNGCAQSFTLRYSNIFINPFVKHKIIVFGPYPLQSNRDQLYSLSPNLTDNVKEKNATL